MPDSSLTKEQRAEALLKMLGVRCENIDKRLGLMRNFEQQHGVLTEQEVDEARSKLNTTLGIRKVFVTPTDIGEKEALKLCGQLLDDKHYDLLLDDTGVIETLDGELLAILLKNRMPQELLDAARPVIRKAAHRKVAAGNRGVAAGTGMQPRRRKDGSPAKAIGVPYLKDLGDEDYKRLKPAKEGTWGYSTRSVRVGQV